MGWHRKTRYQSEEGTAERRAEERWAAGGGAYCHELFRYGWVFLNGTDMRPLRKQVCFERVKALAGGTAAQAWITIQETRLGELQREANWRLVTHLDVYQDKDIAGALCLDGYELPYVADIQDCENAGDLPEELWEQVITVIGKGKEVQAHIARCTDTAKVLYQFTPSDLVVMAPELLKASNMPVPSRPRLLSNEAKAFMETKQYKEFSEFFALCSMCKAGGMEYGHYVISPGV